MIPDPDRIAAVFARTDAWHKLGTVVGGCAFNAQEAMKLGSDALCVLDSGWF